MKQPPKRLQLLIANIAGGFGYFSCLMQWLWVIIIFLPGILDDQTFKSAFMPEKSSVQPTVHTLPEAVTPVLLVVAGFVTITMIAITLYALWKIPSALTKTGGKLTQTATAAALPVVTQHKKVSPAKKRVLTFTISFSIKFLCILLPYLLLLLPIGEAFQLDKNIVWVVGSFFAIGSLLWFSLQYGISRIYRLPPSKLL